MKNKIFRRVIAGVMSLGILLSMVPMAVTAAYDYTETIDKVTSLNVVPEKIEADTIVTRKELAKFLYYMINVAENGAVYRDDSFYDIDETNEYYEYICAIAGYGLMVGVEEGVFAPDMNATFGMAVKVLIDATGYYPLAREGDLNAYQRVASERGMLKNVNYVANQPITMGELAQLIWNALQMRAVETTIAGNSTQIVTDVDLLWHYHKIALSEGQVTQNAYTAINNATGLTKGYVKIDYTIYKAGTDSIGDLLGKYVDFYYKVDDDFNEPVILWAKSQGSKTLAFTNKDDVTALGRTITHKTSSKQKTYQLSSTVKMIYNGKYKTYNEADINELVIGTIELVDVDSNKEYDFVIVKSYIPYIVLGREADERKIYDKGSKPTVEISKNADVKVTKNGVLADFVNLAVDDVVLIASDKYTIVDGEKVVDSANSTLLDLVVSDNSVVGTVSEINTEERTAVINGEVYDIAATFDGSGNTSVALGEKSTFYIDAFGNVVYVVKGEALSGSKGRRVDGIIGYVTRYGDPARSREEKITARIFDQNGKWATYDFAEKVRIDGDVYKTPQAQYTYLTSGDIRGRVDASQLAGYIITFRLNSEGKISFIDTGKVGPKEAASETMELSRDTSAWNETNGGYYHYGGVVYSAFQANPIFVLPASISILTVPINTSKQLMTSSDFESGYKWANNRSESDKWYRFEAWNIGDNDVPEVLVCYDTSAGGAVTFDRSYVYAMVTDIVDTLNEDNEPITRLTLMGNAGTKVIDITEETIIKRQTLSGLSDDDDAEPSNGKKVTLKLGDVILYNLTASGVTNIDIKFSLEAPGGSSLTTYNEKLYSSLTSSMHQIWGNLYRMDGDVVQVQISDNFAERANRFSYINNSTNATIVCYDLDENTFEYVSGDSLRSYVKTRALEQTDKIFIRRNWGIMESIFVYRNVQ